jgi:hypothetical protein
MKLMDPVCSPIFKHQRGGLVLRWVTTGESPLLYVFEVCFCSGLDTPAAFRANVPNRNGQLPMQVDAVVKDQFENIPGLISTNEIMDVKYPVGR